MNTTLESICKKVGAACPLAVPGDWTRLANKVNAALIKEPVTDREALIALSAIAAQNNERVEQAIGVLVTAIIEVKSLILGIHDANSPRKPEDVFREIDESLSLLLHGQERPACPPACLGQPSPDER